MLKFFSRIAASLGSKDSRKSSTQEIASCDDDMTLSDVLTANCIKLDLAAADKEGTIKELVGILDSQGLLPNAARCLEDVLQRERIMSTGMQHGVALPHAKTDGVDTLRAVLAISKEGIDFESMDGEPTRFFVLILSPKKVAGPHIRFLAAASAALKEERVRERLLAAENVGQVIEVLAERPICGPEASRP